jgi:hypothetical protein
MIVSRRSAAVFAAAVALALAVGGCAARQRVQAQRSEELLAAAGFRQVQADTAERAEALRRMRPRTLTELLRDGRTFYVYADPDACRCLYVGSGDEYDEYRKLAREQQHPEPQPLPWNEAEFSAGWEGWGGWDTWGAWPWWD